MTPESAQLEFAEFSDDRIRLGWKNDGSSEFHPLWLRDNCRCEDCGDPAVGYRKLRLTALDPDCRPQTLRASDAELAITWQDGHDSIYSTRWLRTHAYDDATRRRNAFRPPLWDDALRREPPQFDYAEVAGDAGLLQLLQCVRDHGICFVQGAPTEAGIVEDFARRYGYPQESNFGLIQDLIFDPKKRSIAFDVKALKPHTDEPYRASPPGLLLFHCIRNDQTGAGSSLFVDGFEIAERLRAADADGFAALCAQAQAFRRHFEGEVDLIAEFPILSVDEFGNLCGVRINDRVAAPASIDPTKIDVYYRGLRFLLAAAEDLSLAMQRTLQPGDIAIFDNHRVLHGRSDLTIDGQRWLQWLQIERGDFHSSLRIFADRLGLPRDALPLLRGAYGSAVNWKAQ